MALRAGLRAIYCPAIRAGLRRYLPKADVLARPTFLRTLHWRRRAMLLPRTSPGPLLLDRVLVLLVNADLSLLMDRDEKRSPRRAALGGTRSREPRETRDSDSVMRRCPLCRRKRRRFAFNRWDPRFVQVDNTESRIDQSPARDGKGEQRDAIKSGEWQSQSVHACVSSLSLIARDSRPQEGRLTHRRQKTGADDPCRLTRRRLRRQKEWQCTLLYAEQ